MLPGIRKMMHRSLQWNLLLSLTLVTGCMDSLNPTVTGSGVSRAEQREISKFTSVELFGVGTLTVNPGKAGWLKVEADDNMLQYVQSSVNGETLRIGVGSGTYTWNTGYPRFELQESTATRYELQGQTQLILNSAEMDTLKLKLDGQCSVTLNGTIDQLKIDVSGQCVIDAANASIKEISGDLNGQSTVICHAYSEVNVKKNSDSVIKKNGTE